METLRLTFDNGWAISIGIGEALFRDDDSAEIGVLNPAGELIQIDDDTVRGYSSPEVIARVAYAVASLDPDARDEDVTYRLTRLCCDEEPESVPPQAPPPT